jgi:hypothetical protein
MEDVAVEPPFEETGEEVRSQEGEQEREPAGRELTPPELREKEAEGQQQERVLAERPGC